MILFIITLLGTLAVQFWLQRTYGRWSKVQNTSGLTGYETARAILDANNLRDVKIESVQGRMADHYDPRSRTVRLSEPNYHQASVAGSAVAAHEVGHAIQHAKAYAPLQWRAALVPVANIGGNFGPWLVIFGFMMSISGMVQLGIILFGAAVLFQLITLPVEFDASKRALGQMQALGIATSQDTSGARQVLNAAAMTYVAAMVASVAYLLHYVLMFTGASEE